MINYYFQELSLHHGFAILALQCWEPEYGLKRKKEMKSGGEIG